MFQVRAAQCGLRGQLDTPAAFGAGIATEKQRLEDLWMHRTKPSRAVRGQADTRRSQQQGPLLCVSNGSKGSSSRWGRVTIPL